MDFTSVFKTKENQELVIYPEIPKEHWDEWSGRTGNWLITTGKITRVGVKTDEVDKDGKPRFALKIGDAYGRKFLILNNMGFQLSANLAKLEDDQLKKLLPYVTFQKGKVQDFNPDGTPNERAGVEYFRVQMPTGAVPVEYGCFLDEESEGVKAKNALAGA